MKSTLSTTKTTLEKSVKDTTEKSKTDFAKLSKDLTKKMDDSIAATKKLVADSEKKIVASVGKSLQGTATCLPIFPIFFPYFRLYEVVSFTCVSSMHVP